MEEIPESYEDYLRIQQQQMERDRDRFIGRDSHEDEPVFDARDGEVARLPKLEWPEPFDVAAFVERHLSRPVYVSGPAYSRALVDGIEIGNDFFGFQELGD